MNGFYVPGSTSSSYVANKRNEEGSLLYESLENEVGLQKQAAMQQLDKSYAQTIENAYASYLAANRGVDASQMGQGYKELYKQIQNQQLQAGVADVTSQVAQQRQSLNQQEAQAQAQIQQAFQTEVGYFDRLQQSFADYWEYAKTLTQAGPDNTTVSYFDPYELNQSVDSMYDIFAQAQPIGGYNEKGEYVGYTDAEGKAGMTFSEWVASQIGTSDEDQAWYQWYTSGGFNEFMAAPKSTKQWQVGELKAIREEDEALAKDLEDYQKMGGQASARVSKYLSENEEQAAEIESKRFDNVWKSAVDTTDKGSGYVAPKDAEAVLNEIKAALPESDKFVKAEIKRNWGKRELDIVIRDSDVTPELQAAMKKLGFKYSSIWATYGTGEIKGLARFYSESGSMDDIKEIYRKLYDAARAS